MEWQELGNELVQILLPILATFLTGFFTYVGARLKNAYETKVNTETTKAVVDNAVRFVEQVYKDLKGKEKLEKAVVQVNEILTAKGIKITEAEINMLIESAVFGLNQGWFNNGSQEVLDVCECGGNCEECEEVPQEIEAPQETE